jgi:hypothetical protein
MLSFPPQTVFSLAGLRVGFQQFLHTHVQRGFFPRRTPGNGSWQHIACLTPLLEVTLNGRPRDVKTFDDLVPRYPGIHCLKDLLS